MFLVRAAHGSASRQTCRRALIEATTHGSASDQANERTLLVVKAQVRRKLVLTHQLLCLRDELFSLLVEYIAYLI